jgi:beta-lactamase superfamily II metal-dependent hydrolase
MQHVNRNAPAPAVIKTMITTLILSLTVFHFGTPLFAQGPAFDQLKAAASVEVPYAPAPDNAAVYRAAPGLNVYFVSVGQGDSEYIEMPDGKNALIDGGPSSSASSGLAKFLTDKNVTHIDDVVLTHPHADHFSGLLYVFSHGIKVDNFYDTRADNTGSTSDDKLRSEVSAQGVNTHYPVAGGTMDWNEPGMDIKVFNACSDPVSSGDGTVLNNCSIVFKLSYGGSSILFMGDAQSDVENAIMQKFPGELKADVLKVGHHGSKYSSTVPFLQAVKPARAYIEVGQNNYGHPSQLAMGNIQGVGTQIFRTDQDGTQEITADGSGGISPVSYKDFLPEGLGVKQAPAVDNTPDVGTEMPGDD